MEPEKRIVSAFLIVLLIFAAGTLAYRFIMGWTFSDSFYMTLITVSTTGYMEVHSLKRRDSAKISSNFFHTTWSDPYSNNGYGLRSYRCWDSDKVGWGKKTFRRSAGMSFLYRPCFPGTARLK